MNHPPIEQRCRISTDALDLCLEVTARYAGADRSQGAGYDRVAEQLRVTARTTIEVHLGEQALREARR